MPTNTPDDRSTEPNETNADTVTGADGDANDGDVTAPPEVYEQIEEALTTHPDKRQDCIRSALRDLPEDHPHHDEIRAALKAALEPTTDPMEHLRQAYGYLPVEGSSRDESAVAVGDGGTPPEEPPATVHWLGDDNERGLVQIELTRGIIEWIELEADERNTTIDEWIRSEIWVALREDLEQHHALDVDVPIDVPEGLVQRARCWQRDSEADGHPPTPIDDVLDTFVDLEPTYQLDGEPVRDGRRDHDRDGDDE